MSGPLAVCADLFCGAGGTSAGLQDAADELGIETDLLGVNHWDIAIETFRKNHRLKRDPVCGDLNNVNPRVVVPGGRLHLLVASPECTNHTCARGALAMDEHSRAGAWHVCSWISALKQVDAIVVENVPQFMDWRPLNQDNRPDKRYAPGHTFRAWLNALGGLGYRVEYCVLNCADYGDPTCRERFFLMARRGNAKINWPHPTHAKDGMGGLKPWVPARDIIDWDNRGASIFTRKKPLVENTLKRIENGLRKHGGDKLEPFLVRIRGTKERHLRNSSISIGQPCPTLSAGGTHIALVEPLIMKYYGTGQCQPVSSPLPTATTKARFALIDPVVKKGELKDILFRMLTPDELARSHSLGDFDFAGTGTDTIRQVGNSVPRKTAAALCREQLRSVFSRQVA